jgi:hypothetical protein
MPRDPLDLFNSLKEEDVQPDYPGKTAPKNRDSSPLTHEWLTGIPYQEYIVKGVTRKFYTIGSLAKAIGRAPVTVREWERKGWLPPAAFRTPTPKGEQVPGKQVKGRRLYSEAQVVFLVEAMLSFSIDDPHNSDWEGFKAEIANHYPRN